MEAGEEWTKAGEDQWNSKVMDSSRDYHRPRLLHSCGVSLLTMAQNTYRRAEDYDGLLGSVCRTLASIATPIIDPIQHQWLMVLAFVDDHILSSVEDLATAIFPPSAHLFNGLDKLALLADALPEWLDDAIDIWLKSVLKPFVSVGKEREIMVDINCDEQWHEAYGPDEGTEESEALANDAFDSRKEEEEEEEIKEVEKTCRDIMEALEVVGMVGEKNSTTVNGGGGGGGGKGSVEEGREAGVAEMDAMILELFDQGWQLKPLTGGAKKRR